MSIHKEQFLVKANNTLSSRKRGLFYTEISSFDPLISIDYFRRRNLYEKWAKVKEYYSDIQPYLGSRSWFNLSEFIGCLSKLRIKGEVLRVQIFPFLIAAAARMFKRYRRCVCLTSNVFDILSMSKGQRIRVMITTVVVLTTWFCDWTDKNEHFSGRFKN